MKDLSELNIIQTEEMVDVISRVISEYMRNVPEYTDDKPDKLPIVSKDHIGLELATTIIHKVALKAAEMGVKAVIAVYNSSANPVAIHVMDDAYIASFDVASNKAYTSAALKMSTLTLKALSGPGSPLYGIQNTNQGRIVIFGGGEPLYYKGRQIGAIGVSGGNEEQDSKLAEFGKTKLEEVF